MTISVCCCMCGVHACLPCSPSCFRSPLFAAPFARLRLESIVAPQPSAVIASSPGAQSEEELRVFKQVNGEVSEEKGGCVCPVWGGCCTCCLSTCVLAWMLLLMCCMPLRATRCVACPYQSSHVPMSCTPEVQIRLSQQLEDAQRQVSTLESELASTRNDAQRQHDALSHEMTLLRQENASLQQQCVALAQQVAAMHTQGGST